MRPPRAVWKSITGIGGLEDFRFWLMALYLLLIVASYTAAKAVRDSLFVTEVGPARLPYLYLLIAAGMALMSAVYAAALRRIGLYSAVRWTSLIVAASLVGFWRLVAGPRHVSFYVLYVWVSLFGAIAASQTWSLAAHVFDAREARRGFASIGLGGVLGGIAGGALARIVAPWAGTEALLPVCSALMLFTVGILHAIVRPNGRDVPQAVKPLPEDDRTTGTVLGAIRKSPYLSMVAALFMAGVIVEAFIDYEFKTVAAGAFESRDRLTSYFGVIASYGGILALLFQTLVTGRLLNRFGVGIAILLFPGALLAGFLVVFVWPTLWALSLLKLIDGCLSYSVHRSATELLYVPIPVSLRAPVKTVIDLLVDRAGRAVGGGLLLLLTAGLSLSVPSLSLVAAACLGVWIAIAVAVRSRYVDAFRSALDQKAIEPEALDVRTLNRTTIGALLHDLSDPDDRRVLGALDFLGRVPSARWRRHLPRLLQHRSGLVRARTIAMLTEWGDADAPFVEESLRDPDLEVRIEAVRYLCVVSTQPESRLKEFLDQKDYRIVLAAIHCMEQHRLGERGLVGPDLIKRAITTKGRHEIPAKTVAASGLAIVQPPETSAYLDRLLRDSHAEVVREAARTAGEIGYRKAIPVLISMLARRDVRYDARRALVRLGRPAMEALQVGLLDHRTAVRVRARIPKTLSLFGTQEVAEFLLARVHVSTSGLDMPLVKALHRMRQRFPEIAFEPERVSLLIESECKRYLRLRMDWQTFVERNRGGAEEMFALISRTMEERLAETVERMFRLLGLIYSPSDIRTIFLNFTIRPEQRASALEFLDNLIDPALKLLVMPVLEDYRNRVEGLDDDWLETIARELAAREG